MPAGGVKFRTEPSGGDWLSEGRTGLLEGEGVAVSGGGIGAPSEAVEPPGEPSDEPTEGPAFSGGARGGASEPRTGLSAMPDDFDDVAVLPLNGNGPPGNGDALLLGNSTFGAAGHPSAKPDDWPESTLLRDNDT